MGSDLHHGGRPVGGAEGTALAGGVDTAGEDVCPAVLAAEHRPLGEHRQPIQGSRAAGTGDGVRQDPVVEVISMQ